MALSPEEWIPILFQTGNRRANDELEEIMSLSPPEPAEEAQLPDGLYERLDRIESAISDLYHLFWAQGGYSLEETLKGKEMQIIDLGIKHIRRLPRAGTELIEALDEDQRVAAAIGIGVYLMSRGMDQ